MKGIGKALARTPFAVTSKIGMSKRSSDPEFEEYQRHFTTVEQATDKLIKDTKAFSDAVLSLFTSGAGFASHFAVIFQAIQGEASITGKYPDADHNIRNMPKYEAVFEELKTLIAPELELINSRIGEPTKELQSVLRLVRKSITKREHKLTDYDRFNNSLTKLRDKKDKSLGDEKNLFKLEQDFEIATHEYEFINTALKQDLPRFLMLSTQFIDPLFKSFFYMQLNIFYLILEKMNGFADEAKYDISNVPAAQIAQEYEEKRTDAWSVIENLSIVKRIISVSRLVQASRAQGQSGQTSLGRQGTTSSSSSTSNLKLQPRSVSSGSDYKKSVPPPQTNSSQAAPPPYSPSFNTGASAAATKRPAPPPPLKPKPKSNAPQIKYVVALYDFAAQTDGDLSFNTGDRIELVEKTQSTEDWWTGRLNGVQGVFPGNYVQET